MILDIFIAIFQLFTLIIELRLLFNTNSIKIDCRNFERKLHSFAILCPCFPLNGKIWLRLFGVIKILCKIVFVLLNVFLRCKHDMLPLQLLMPSIEQHSCVYHHEVMTVEGVWDLCCIYNWVMVPNDRLVHYILKIRNNLFILSYFIGHHFLLNVLSELWNSIKENGKPFFAKLVQINFQMRRWKIFSIYLKLIFAFLTKIYWW